METPKNQRATKKQKELLSFIDGFVQGNGYGPSYREIMRALEYKSVSTVATHVNNLIAKGYLAKTETSARSLTVMKAASRAASQEEWLAQRLAAHKAAAAESQEPDAARTIEAIDRVAKLFDISL